MKRVALVLVLFGALATYSRARLSRAWTHEELLAESDFVGFIEPLSNEPTKDVFTIEVNGGEKINYHGIDTHFRVALVLKSRSKAEKQLTVLHFSDESAEAVVNGPEFIYFPIGPLEYEKRFLKDGKELSKMTIYAGEPLLLAFLKHRSDGRYEPITGQEDPDESFYELHRPSFPYPSTPNQTLQPTASPRR
jgi:hypothetical protein